MEGSQAIRVVDADADPRRNLTIPLLQKASRKMQKGARENYQCRRGSNSLMGCGSHQQEPFFDSGSPVTSTNHPVSLDAD